MAVTLLDSYSESIGSYAASFAVSAGANRKAYVAVIHSSSTNANPPTSATLGGQAMSLVVSGDSGGPEDVTATIFCLDESGISAMSGSALSISGGSKTSQSTVTFSVQDADQGTDASNSRADVGSSGAKTISLARAADSFTFGVAVCDFSDSTSMTITGNPSEVAEFGGTNMDVAYGGEADTDRTADFGYTVGPVRDSAGLVINIAPAATGPVVDSITDPIIGTDAVTIALTEADATIDTIDFTVGSVTQSQSYTTGDDTTFTISAVTRDLLPPIGTVTVELKAGVSVIASTTATLQQAAGYSVVTGSGVVDANCLPHTGFLDNGDIALSTDNITVSTDFTDATQTTREAGSIQFWDASEENWGDVVLYPVDSGDSGVIGSIINSVIIQSIIS